VIPTMFDMVVDQQVAWFAEQQRSWQRLLSVPRVAQLACETRVGGTPHDVVFQMGTVRLLRYRRETPALYSEPVLFCYALINRHYILDLQPDKSVVQRYLDRGFDVYMIDWGVPSDADHHLTLDDYVGAFLEAVVDFIVGEHKRSDLHLLGYCMGGTMSAMFTAIHPERIKSLTVMAAPIDFGGRESLLNVWTDRKYFDVDSLIDSYGNCPAFFLQSCFQLLKPVQNLLEKHLTLFDQLDDPRFVSNFFAMEYWVN
jgi:polyhydroxyalkanoate synthase